MLLSVVPSDPWYDRCSYITRSGIEFAQFATFFIVSQAVYVIRCAS
jgi:hypothetical protein